MATESQKVAFIHEVAPCAIRAFSEVGKVWPSICIAMACVESGYGTSKIMRNHNAFMGQKVGSGKTATKYWSGNSFSAKTKEEYTVGVHTTIRSAFRAYDSMQQCILNYYELLNTKLYGRVQPGVHYSTQMQQIKDSGYMTSSTEVNSVIKLIERYNLTQYDKGEPTEYEVGKTYTTVVNLYIRKDPHGDKCTLEDLTINGRENAYTDDEGKAILKKGTRVTCKIIFNNAEGETWMRIPSGWICARTASGKSYIY